MHITLFVMDVGEEKMKLNELARQKSPEEFLAVHKDSKAGGNFYIHGTPTTGFFFGDYFLVRIM